MLRERHVRACASVAESGSGKKTDVEAEIGTEAIFAAVDRSVRDLLQLSANTSDAEARTHAVAPAQAPSPPEEPPSASNSSNATKSPDRDASTGAMFAVVLHDFSAVVLALGVRSALALVARLQRLVNHDGRQAGRASSCLLLVVSESLHESIVLVSECAMRSRSLSLFVV